MLLVIFRIHQLHRWAAWKHVLNMYVLVGYFRQSLFSFACFCFCCCCWNDFARFVGLKTTFFIFRFLCFSSCILHSLIFLKKSCHFRNKYFWVFFILYLCNFLREEIRYTFFYKESSERAAHGKHVFSGYFAESRGLG